MKNTKPLFIGLGIAIVLSVFVIPLAISEHYTASKEKECISLRGEWKGDGAFGDKYCHFKDNKS